MKNKTDNFLIKKIFDSFNFKKNNFFLIHTDLSNYLPNYSWKEKCESLNNFFNEYFVHKTILIPTFTYSFCKTGLYNKKKTNSEVGIFTEYFRIQKNTIRTDHPIFSFACRGKNAKLIFENNSNSATGKGSVFEKLRVFDANIIFFGTNFINSCTFLHYIEQCFNVEYRYSKFFFEKNKSANTKEWEFYVRNIELFKFPNLKFNKKITVDLRKNKILFEKKINNLRISYCSARKLYDFIFKKLQKNKYYILGSKPSYL